MPGRGKRPMTTEALEELKKRIAELREAGVTIAMVAERLGVNRWTVDKYKEKGK